MPTLLSLLLCLFLTGASAQTTPAPVPPKPDYSQEAFVVEQHATELAFENDGTGTQKTTARVRIQSDAGVQRFAVITFPYQSSTQTLEIDYVRVRKPDASLVVTPPESVQDMASEITRQAPLYSDLREKHVAVKGLGVGDVLEYEIQGRTTKPLAPGQFWFAYNFSNDELVLAETLQISVPRDRAVKWGSSNRKPTITETSTRRVFSWSAAVLERKSKEQQENEQRTAAYDAARGKFPPPDVQISSFQNWEEVGRWYSGLQEERAKPTPETRAKAADLTKGLSDDRAKAGAIYNYVSTQIHYIGIDFGIGRYQPHSASEVLGNQYGDCKDKHTLLAALLEAAGIRARPVLISSSRDVDPDVPSPAQFDHVISAVWLGDHLTWLDTTQEVSPFAYLLSPLRGKSALLVSTDKPPALITTPADPPTKPSETFRIDATLSDAGILDGKSKWTFQGDDAEVLLRMAFRRTPIAQWKDLAQQLSYAANFAGEVSDLAASSPEKTDEPFQFGYSYHRKDYPGWSDRHAGSPLPIFPLQAAPEKDVQSSVPIWLGPPVELHYESHVEIPKGYTAAPPPNLDLSEDFAEYHRVYSIKGRILTTDRRFVVKLHEVPVKEFEAYRNFVKAASADQEKTLPLSSNAAPFFYQTEIWDLPGSDNADAARAYDDARDKMSKQDPQGAMASIKHAVEVDPKYTRAWLWLGEMYLSNRQLDEAVAAYRKAISVDPQVAVSYKALGMTLSLMRNTDEAIPVWRQLIKVAPNDRMGYEMLGTLFFGLKRYAEAKSLLEAAIQLDPESAPVRGALAAVYLHTGELEKAMAEYRKVLELAPQPYTFNSVAYELAEADQQLPLALEYAKRAVTEEGAVSRKVDLAQLKTEDLQSTSALAAFWDTLGWVYFKMGSLVQAEKYLNAAWVLSQDAAVADHLGQLYERQNKKQAAIHMYRFALAQAKEKRSSGLDTAKTGARLELLSPGASNPGLRSVNEIASELSQVRTTKLSLPVKDEESAEFFLLLSRNKVEAVKFISGSERIKSAEAALKSANYKVEIPEDGDPRLLRRGVMFCSELSGCSITLMSPSEVKSVN